MAERRKSEAREAQRETARRTFNRGDTNNSKPRRKDVVDSDVRKAKTGFMQVSRGEDDTPVILDPELKALGLKPDEIEALQVFDCIHC